MSVVRQDNHYSFGWCEGNHQAWRVNTRRGRSPQSQVPTNTLQTAGEHTEAHHHIVARWPDGKQRPMPGLTFGMCKSMADARQESSRKKKGEANYWTKLHRFTQQLLLVRPRAHRGQLVSLDAQGAKVLQVHSKGFANGVPYALKSMAHLGEEHEKPELQSVRDERLKWGRGLRGAAVSGNHGGLRENTTAATTKVQPHAKAKKKKKLNMVWA